ncbi:MAG: sugar phosphate isomerase/epimerase family protein [Thermoproteota archaeon]
MKICISTVSLSHLDKKRDLATLIAECLEAGMRNIELNEVSCRNREHAATLFSSIKEHEGSVVAFTLGLNMLGGDVRSNEKYFNSVKNWIKICNENDCRILRLKAVPRENKTYSENDFRLLYRNLLNILPSLEKNKVEISIDAAENVYASMDMLLRVIEDIGSEAVGMTLDARTVEKLREANILERVLPLVNHVSMKDSHLKNPARRELEEAFRALRMAAYNGYVSLELQDAGSIEEVKEEFDVLNELISKI